MTIRKLLNYWNSKKRSGFYIFLGFGAAAIYFVGVMIRSSFLKRTGFLAFLVIVLAFFIHLNLHAIHWFLEHFQDTSHVPRKQIALVNSFCMTLFLSLALAALPASAFCLEPLWQAIGQWFSSRISPDKIVNPAILAAESAKSPDFSALLGEPKPTAPCILFLDKIVRAAGSFIAVLFIILTVRRLLLAIWSWIIKPRHFDGDETVCLTPAWVLSSKAKEKSLQGKEGKFRFLSYDEKIRRHYRKKILTLSRKKKLRLHASASPSELEQTVGLDEKTLHRLYEKARYSQRTCSKADWDMV